MDWVLYKPVVLQEIPWNVLNYKVTVEVFWEDGMNLDFSDISFLDTDGKTEIRQYRLLYTSGVSSFWNLIIPWKPATEKLIFMLFDNAEATLRSEATDPFLDFTGGVYVCTDENGNILLDELGNQVTVGENIDTPMPGTTGETMDVWGVETMLNSYIDDISFRIGNPRGNRWQYYPHIQRTLQRLYWRLCKEYRLVKTELEMDFSTLTPFVAYWTLPRWFMKLYKLDPDFNWREPDEFDPDEADTYTIDAGKIYFGGIAATDVITMYFYSSGKIFTAKVDADLLAGEINVPEWTDRALDQTLYYGACVELKQDYPGFKHDVNEYNEMKMKMADSFDSDQDKDLVLPGDPAPEPLDAYGW